MRFNHGRMNELEQVFPDPRRPFGAWPSDITPEIVAGETLRFGHTQTDGDAVYWLESRPAENGRGVIMRWTTGEGRREVTQAAQGVRTRAHEYGGGDFCVAGERVVFADGETQRLFLSPGEKEPRPLTRPGEWRYADLQIDAARDRVICVVEDHGTGDAHPANWIGSAPLAGESEVAPIIAGNDFYSNPIVARSGDRMAWLTWNHPHMPWDETELWVAAIDGDGAVKDERLVAGGNGESIFQPRWGPDESLYYVSDRTGWWNLYCDTGAEVTGVLTGEFEVGMPQWVFGMSTYAFAGAHRLVAAVNEKGIWHLVAVELSSGRQRRLNLPYASFHGLRGREDGVACIAGSPRDPEAVVVIGLDCSRPVVVQRSCDVTFDADQLSHPQAISFPTEGGHTAHGFYYPPTHPHWVGQEEEKPPLIVKGHGGPTACAEPVLDLRTQFWTSRGFAVLDVNYRGSTGFGRAYRELLDGRWGIADVEDCVAGARHLVEAKRADEERLVITGRSAGGFTTLAALAFHDAFRAGSVAYGIADLEQLVKDTHKFEAKYVDRLVAPYPEGRAVYHGRSPIHALDGFQCPVIFFQGEDDKVVPPNQAEAMVGALRERGVGVAYLLFPGEGHGFRQADTVCRVLEAELSFYATVFDFEPADEVEPVEIENL